MDSADSHHTANSMCYEPGGAVYLSDGVFHRTQVETPWGPPVRNTDAAIYRFEPRTSKFERYIPYGFANPHGRVFDYWGTDFVTDATGNNTYFGPAFSGHLAYPDKHPSMKQFWERPNRPCPGTGILSSRHFPEEFQGNFLNINVITFQGIYRVKVEEEGSGLSGETIPENLVSSDDPNFRPTAVDVAPDGSVYFVDWHNPIIGHMQHHIRDPNRDHTHGRIYRMTYEGRPLLKPAQIAGQPIEKLLDLLKEPENNVRTRAKIELGARDSQQVLAAAQKWAKQFSAKKIEDQHHLMEALWVHQWHNVINESLLRQMLKSPDAHARAAAVHVLCYWRDRVKEPLALLQVAANDPSPRVRLEAVRAASFFEGNDALDVAYESQKYETDYYLDYTFKETTRQLTRGSKEIYLPKDPKAVTAVLAKLSDKELMQVADIEPVLMERLTRRSVEINARNIALQKLASLHKTDNVSEAIAALRRLDTKAGPAAAVKDVATILVVQPASDLSGARTSLTELSRGAKQDSVRGAAYAALVAAEGKPDSLWAQTEKNTAARVTLIDSIVMQLNPDSRSPFEPLLLAALGNSKTPANVRSAALRALPLMGPDYAATNFDILATHLSTGRGDLSSAARSVLELPRTSWNKEQAPAVTKAILDWARTIPASRRTSQDYVETVQVGMEMASLLPAAQSASIRKNLLDLGVRVFVIKTVREQMRYDTPRIVVQAGKPFEIIFENNDMMPHNIVVVQPGAREEVGTEAQTMSGAPNKQGKAYIPTKSKKIIASSKLLEPGQKETLKLTAPTKTGDYEYVCTYPEHWKVMFGQMVVVKDLDAVLEASARPAPPPPSAEAHQHNH
jgi:azurin